jgi:FdhD protein
MPPHHTIALWKYADGHFVEAMDALACEEPLEIRVRGRAVSVTMRTPGQDEELAAGFLLSEGIVRGREDILKIIPCELDRPEAENRIDVLLGPLVHVDFERLTRHLFSSSSCGLCGKATIESIRRTLPPIQSTAAIGIETLLSLPQRMRSAQATFDRTGGLHAAALFDTRGHLLVLREDIGRHNAVDKVIGHALLAGEAEALKEAVLLVSGRAGFEIVQKAQAAGIPIVSAVSAPSSLAVDLAQSGGQTLVGFMRAGRMNVYTHPQRIAQVGLRPSAKTAIDESPEHA